MPKKQSNKRSTRSVGADEVEGNVDKIRDILFGSQMRDYDERLDSMEERLLQTIERSARDTERRVERLDKYARREVDKLTEQLKAERRDRAAEGKKGASEISNLSGQMEAWFAEVDKQLAAESRDVRNELKDQARDLTAQIREAHSQLQASMRKETADLAAEKLAPEDLAALLSDLAMRLKKDLKLPKG